MKKSFKIFILVVLILGIVGASAYLGYYYSSKDKKASVFSALNYVALGDSITYAIDGSRNSSKIQTPYCEIVKNTLGLKFVTNYGSCGSTICTATNSHLLPSNPMCERYKNMRDDADIVSVMGGTNDFGRFSTLGTVNDTQTSTFYGALDTLAKGLKEKYPNAFIFFMTPLKLVSYAGLRDEGAEFDLYRQAIKDVCAKYEIPVLDTAKLADTSQEFCSENYSGDGLHPSKEFHKKVLAPVIVDFIKKNYKTK